MSFHATIGIWGKKRDQNICSNRSVCAADKSQFVEFVSCGILDEKGEVCSGDVFVSGGVAPGESSETPEQKALMREINPSMESVLRDIHARFSSGEGVGGTSSSSRGQESIVGVTGPEHDTVDD
ncbi:hypothetical protein VI817_000070 [Penicillium citrinum]|nr:hypothetical protein VI817_000070 [Penicillium citrinum]